MHSCARAPAPESQSPRSPRLPQPPRPPRLGFHAATMRFMDGIAVPISPGELLDKITILRIKAARIEDAGKLGNVRRELALLEQLWQQSVSASAELSGDEAALERVNARLWDIEDRIREHEERHRDRKSTRLNSSHVRISYAVFCLKKKKKILHLLRNDITDNIDSLER